MNKEALLTALEEYGATEAVLAELECPYSFHYSSSVPGITGYALVVVEEGLLSLPYGAVIPTEGYEQFLPDKAEIIGEEELDDIITEAEFMVETVRTIKKKLFGK